MAAKKKVAKKVVKKAAKKVVKKAAKKVSRSKVVVVTDEVIGERAYEIYLGRVEKGVPGSAEGDWLEAERELRS